MNAIVLLAWRSLWRNRRRTLLTVAGVSFAAAILIFFMSIQFSAWDASVASTSHVLTGHLQVQRDDYLDRPEIRRSFPLDAELLKKIRSIPQVIGAAPGVETSVILSTGERSYVVMLSGVDPEVEKLVSNIPERVVEGRYIAPGAYSETVIGEKLARNIGVTVGSEVSLVGQDRDGSLVSEVLTVTGLVRSGLAEVDRRIVQINRETFDQLFSMNGDVHRIKILGKSVDDLAEIRSQVDSVVEGAANGPAGEMPRHKIISRSWDELIPGLRQAIDLDMSAGWMFYGALLLVCAISVLNTFLMAVLERETEFALLLSLGLSPLQLAVSITLESLLLTAIGIAGGAAAGALLVWYYGSYGFVIPGSEEMLKMWALPSRLYPHFQVEPWVRGISAIVMVGIVSMIIPLFRLWSIKPVEARR